MSKNIYRNFVFILEKWPVDVAKKGRDLGEFIRAEITRNFPKGEITNISNPSECNRIYESLSRISRNVHSNKYPRIYNSTSMGLSPEISGKVISNEVIEEINKS